MKDPDYPELDADIIDITPGQRRRPGRIKWVIFAILIALIAIWRGSYIYVESLWFGSLGFSSRYWYVLELGWLLFAVFGILTFGILRGGFYLLERWFQNAGIVPRTIIVNKQKVKIDLFAYLRRIGWGVAIVFAIIFALALSNDWQSWVLYFHGPRTAATDPIFGHPVGFYLFSLPIYELISGWLLTLSVILLIAAVVYSAAAVLPDQMVVDEKRTKVGNVASQAYSALSVFLGAFLLLLALRTFLSRYSYLSVDHSSFSGVTYSEANYLLPGLTIVAIALVIAGAILFVNACTRRSLRFVVFAIGVPIVVYLISVVIVPIMSRAL